MGYSINRLNWGGGVRVRVTETHFFLAPPSWLLAPRSFFDGAGPLLAEHKRIKSYVFRYFALSLQNEPIFTGVERPYIHTCKVGMVGTTLVAKKQSAMVLFMDREQVQLPMYMYH